MGSPRGRIETLLHLWTENCNLTRRVVGILEQSDSHVILAVKRFRKSRPDRLELVRVDFSRSAKSLSREDFCDHLRRILAEQFPDEEVEKISVAADLEHTPTSRRKRKCSGLD